MYSDLQQLQREINTCLRGLDAAQTQLRPDGDAARWSIQQIVEHLLLTYASSCSVFETRIAKSTPTRARPSIQQRLGQLLVLRVGYFPKGRRAPEMVTPPEFAEPLSGETLAARTEGMLMRLDGLTAEAQRLFGGRRAISHAVLGPLSVRQWCRFQGAHGRHHLQQIRAIRLAHGV